MHIFSFFQFRQKILPLGVQKTKNINHQKKKKNRNQR
jgi:hypothetical protein